MGENVQRWGCSKVRRHHGEHVCCSIADSFVYEQKLINTLVRLAFSKVMSKFVNFYHISQKLSSVAKNYLGRVL